MWISRLQVRDFRSYAECDLELAAGAVVFVGANGQGKTNLVEAIGYCSALDSHRVHGDAPLIRADADHAVVRTTAMAAVPGSPEPGRPTTVEIQLNRTGSNRVQIDGQVMGRGRDVVGVIRSALFAPEHLRLVKGEPADRRRFLDSVMVQVAPRYLGVRSDFERALKQRNAALRSLVTAPSAEAEAVLSAWDERYVPVAAELTWGRVNAARQLASVVSEAYQQISPAQDHAVIGYETASGDPESLDEVMSVISSGLAARRRDEIRRGVTLVGPHRDDLILLLNGAPARTHASHGESWSFALALQLASFHVLHRITDDPPVLILDDVFAELDEQRRERLLDAVAAAEQILVTAAVAADVPHLKGQVFEVAKEAGGSTVVPVVPPVVPRWNRPSG